MNRNAMIVVAGLSLMPWIAGCRINVNKDSNGQEKSVQVDTPFGGVHVNTDQTSAADLGLPLYPGAELAQDKQDNKSADIHMGFGEWQLRVRAVSYESADPKDKILDFYKKALARYGDVISCQGNAPVGTPAVTSQGLSCSDDGKNSHFKFNGKPNGVDFSGDLQLKAGSRRHQHIVGFETPANGKTQFALVALDLPAGVDSSSGNNN